MSDILANMYLTDFDTKMNTLVGSFNFGFFRRYSDDILFICPQDKIKQVYATVEKQLSEGGLKINKNKTELFYLNRNLKTLVDKTGLLVHGYAKNKTSIQYLGFEFDLDDMHVRSGTIANHYRKMKRAIKKEVPGDSKDDKPAEPRVPRKNSDKKDKYAYLKKAAQRIDGARLSRQLITVRRRVSRMRRERKTREESQ